MKIISPILLVPSFILLTACGGGSDDKKYTQSTGSSNSDFTFYEVYLSSSEDKKKIEIEGAKIKIDNNFVYMDLIDGMNAADLQLEKYSYLTSQGLYEVDHTRYADGYRVSKVLSLNPSSLITSPYNLIGYTDLQFSFNYKWVDISGQKILDIIEENVWVSGDLLPPLEKKLTTTVFPKGSQCLQFSGEKSNKDSISIDGEADGVYQGKTLQEIKSYYPDVRVQEGRWAGIDWLVIHEDPDYSPAYLIKDGKLYTGEYESGGTTDNTVECDSLNKVAYQTLKDTVAQIK